MPCFHDAHLQSFRMSLPHNFDIDVGSFLTVSSISSCKTHFIAETRATLPIELHTAVELTTPSVNSARPGP